MNVTLKKQNETSNEDRSDGVTPRPESFSSHLSHHSQIPSFIAPLPDHLSSHSLLLCTDLCCSRPIYFLVRVSLLAELHSLLLSDCWASSRFRHRNAQSACSLPIKAAPFAELKLLLPCERWPYLSRRGRV